MINNRQQITDALKQFGSFKPFDKKEVDKYLNIAVGDYISLRFGLDSFNLTTIKHDSNSNM